MTYICYEPLIENKPISIVERDEHGALVGAYIGYYDYKHFVVRLYPDFKNKLVTWRGAPRKKTVSAYNVRCMARQDGKKEKPVKSQTSAGIRGLKDLPGQQKFKF